MIEFVIKSTLCLTILFAFYHFLLQNVKMPVFKRFYLLFALVFALIIPMVTIRINLNLSLSTDIRDLSDATSMLIQGKDVTSESISFLIFQNILTIIYLLISTILLIRFSLNIFKISRLIRSCPSVYNLNTQIVLVEDKTLPYSFFRYIFVNRSDYQNGRIDKELMIHEQTHCSQYHSFDILVIELVKIFLWFIPLIWLFRREIQLNHEFLADDKVLSDCDLKDYQRKLLNLVFRNNSTYLASNFNYSLTKKRLIMMKMKKSKKKAIRILLAIPLFIFLGLMMANAQDTIKIKKEQVKHDVIQPEAKHEQIKHDAASSQIKHEKIKHDASSAEVKHEQIKHDASSSQIKHEQIKHDAASNKEKKECKKHDATIAQAKKGKAEHAAPPPPPPPAEQK